VNEPAAAPSGGGGAFLLFRVDDLLLHGQVALGWAGPLGARSFVIADDMLAADPMSAVLYQAVTPEGSRVRVLTLAAAGRSAGEPEAASSILLVRSVAGAVALLRAGVAGPVNLGGIHLHPGAREYLPYLFLNDEEVAALRDLLRSGAEVFAQDLPSSPRREVGPLLGAGADSADGGARAVGAAGADGAPGEPGPAGTAVPAEAP